MSITAVFFFKGYTLKSDHEKGPHLWKIRLGYHDLPY
jgi:hypothetical protein